MDIDRSFRNVFFMVVILFSSTCHSLDRVGAGVIAFPAEPSDTVIVLDDLPDTDLYSLRTENEYDLVFNFDISKYIGNLDKLIAHGLINQEVKIAVAAYDVDNGPESNAQFYNDCDGDGIEDLVYFEVDEVYLNGKKIGELTSGNNQWAVAKNVLTTDIRQLNFPQNIGATAANVIQIKIDSKNANIELSSGQIGCKRWAAEVDFITVQFDVIDPFVLIPGFGGNSDTFDSSGYKDELMNYYGIPSEVIAYESPANAISYPIQCAKVDTSYKYNHYSIQEQIIALANNWHTDSLNIVAHSKGGLESLYLIDWVLKNNTLVTAAAINNTLQPTKLIIKSLTTHGTPFEGSKLANWVLDTLNTGVGFANLVPYVEHLIPGLCDLTTHKATLFSKNLNFSNKLQQLKIGATLDAYGDSIITDDEISGNTFALLGYDTNVKFWSITGGNKIADYDFESPWFIKTDIKDLVEENDTLVTVKSATSTKESNNVIPIITGANHGTIIGLPEQTIVLNHFKNRTIKWGDMQ